MPRTHDVGGRSGLGVIDRTEHATEEWEKQVFATAITSIFTANLFNLDELRRAIEDMPQDNYVRLGYYERWTVAMETLLIQKGVLTLAEIEEQVESIDARGRQA